ncbi:MAG: HAMP domain-containing sensor histidine kinase [Deltaproteobacteria bacterium]|nr:HAMP domain-containing sensor histidine kinase [Deltaproteobacteria bacterium]
MVKRFPWFLHPVFIFIFSILALATSLFLYIYWYIRVSTGLQALVRRYNLDASQFLEAQTWVVILVLSILVAIILTGTLIIFIYSQKMVRLNWLQHEFINNFTHELKTPVTSLKLYLETFLKHELTREEQIKYIRYMLQDTERLAEHINRILNLAKIETKTYGGEFVTADLVQTVQQFQQHNIHLFRNCIIRIHDPGKAFLYPINQPLFEMLVMNILTNGIKYNDSEQPVIDIRFVRIKNKLHIRFEDNGIGIEKGDLKKIFRKFYQAAAGRPESLLPRGSGLGLYLVQNIARMHKGKVIAANRPEAGAVFTLILPAQRV